MKLKNIFIILAIFGLLSVAYFASAEENATSTNGLPKVAPIISHVEVTNISSSQALISWSSNYPDISYILYGSEDTSAGRSLSAAHRELTANHQLILKDLKPETTYYFRIISDFDSATMLESPSHNFKTLPEELVGLIIVKNSNGAGVVYSGSNVSQDTQINCGDYCKGEFKTNTIVTLTAVAKEGSIFVGWEGDCKLDSPNQCVVTMNSPKVVTAKFELKSTTNLDDRNAPRIMYWWGKVNQHWNIDKGAWETDADGVSGADLDKLTYCKKFYPNTIKVEEYKNETAAIWRDRGNVNQYTSIKMSYRCISSETGIKPNPIFIGPPVSDDNNVPRIMYWYGKVNQHWNLEKKAWETDADGVSGANLDKLTYCKKFYPNTIKVEEYKNETDATWHDRGNVNKYTSIKMSYRCVLGEAETKPHPIFLGPPETVNEIQPVVKPYIEVKTESVERDREEIADQNKLEVTEISGKVEDTTNNQINKLLEELKQLRNRVAEQETEIKYLKGLQHGVKVISEESKTSLNNFITYGVDDNTQKLGSGERAAVIASYKAAYNKLPETNDEITETIKIANGRFPSVISQTAEDKANEEFKKIYGREVDVNNKNDVAAIKVMAYGLRQKAANRKLESEKKGIEIFKNIYGHTPQTTEEWNTMQAITYSGAKK